MKSAFRVATSSLLLAGFACSSPDSPADLGGTGGLPAAGGAVGTGGAAAGGTLSTGGTLSSGGALPTGGASAGGAVGIGGSSAGGSAAGGASAGGAPTGAGGDETGSGGIDGGGGTPGAGGSPSTGSPGCGKAATRPDPRQQQTIQVGNLTRYYLMYVPENYDPDTPLPLVFGIHGLNMNNVWAAHDQSGFQLIEATQGKALLVYPQGIRANGQSTMPSSQSQWGDADSNWGGPPPNADPQRIQADLAYFDAILEFVNANYCVDTKKVFSVGFSQGGFMTNVLGCERPDVFRALAPVAGWGPHGSNPSCSKQDAAHAILQTQGTTDGTVTVQLAEATRNFWRDRAGCSNMTMNSSHGQGCIEYQGCDDGKPVVYCTHGGDHFVPGGTGARAWSFFQSLD